MRGERHAIPERRVLSGLGRVLLLDDAIWLWRNIIGHKSGQHDKRCVMEARLEGQQPTAVTCKAATLNQAIAGATNKLKRILDATLEQLRGHQS